MSAKVTASQGRAAVREALAGLLTGAPTYAYLSGVREALTVAARTVDEATGDRGQLVFRTEEALERVLSEPVSLDELTEYELAEVASWVAVVEAADGDPYRVAGPAPEALRVRLPAGHFLRSWRLTRKGA